MKRAVFSGLAAAFVLTGMVFAQAKPDFSGTWTLDPAKSEMGGPGRGMGGGGMGGGGMMGGPMTVTIKQTAADLTIERKMGDQMMTATYKLDGSESVNKGMRGNDVKSTAKWDGSNLVITSTQENQQGGAMQSTEVRSLSPDGKTMTVEMTRQTPRGEMKQKMVFNKTS